MSDFLTSLVGRTLGTITVVAPHRHARFEPPANAGAPALHDVVAETAAAAPRPSTDLPPRRPLFAPAPGRPHSADGREPRPHPVPVAAELVRDVAGTRAHAVASPALASTQPRSGTLAPKTATPATTRVPGAPRATSLQSPASPRREPAPADRGPSPASAPAIHITIGRVEVRAIHRPDQPARPALTPAPPRTSLAHYLRHGRASDA